MPARERGKSRARRRTRCHDKRAVAVARYSDARHVIMQVAGNTIVLRRVEEVQARYITGATFEELFV